MAVTDYSHKQFDVGIIEQTVWGTGELDSATLNSSANGCLLAAEAPDLDPDVKKEELPEQLGSRIPTVLTNIQHTNGSMPKITLKGPVRLNDIDLLLASFFNSVIEVDATPYKKTFTQGTGAPCDFSTDGGYPLTIWLKHPTASKSIKLIDCVCESLKFVMEEGKYLRYEAVLVSRGPITATANPSGTWTASDNDFLFQHQLGQMLYAGSGYYCKTFEFNMMHEVVGLGHSSGKHQTFALPNWSFDYTVTYTDNAGVRPTFDAAEAAGTRVDFRIGWGNGTPGTDENDFDIAFSAQVSSPAYTNDGVQHVTFTGRVGAADTSTTPVTIIMANALDRNWPAS